MTDKQLNTLLNSWPEGAIGHDVEQFIIEALNHYGKTIGYGALNQLAEFLRQIQCDHTSEQAASLKRNRFAALGWKLPDDFEEVAKEQP